METNLKSKMNLLTFYSNILTLGNLVTDENGFVSLKSGLRGDKPSIKPIEIKYDGSHKRLVLPTINNLNNAKEGNFIFFHPLRENILRGESEIMTFFRTAINIRVISVASMLMIDILDLVVSPEYQTKLTAKQTSLLSSVKDADSNVLIFLSKLIQKCSYDNSRKRLYSIYLKKNGKINNEPYFCLGVCGFPLYEELVKAEKENAKNIFGIKCRKKDLTTIINLLELLIPGIDNPKENYIVGSNDKQASFLDALLKITLKLISPLNEVTDILFKNQSYLPKEEKVKRYNEYHFTEDWMCLLNNFSSLEKEILLVPPQPGNEGRRPLKDEDNEELNTVSQIENDSSVEPESPRVFETITKPVSNNNQSIFNNQNNRNISNQGVDYRRNDQSNNGDVKRASELFPTYNNQQYQPGPPQNSNSGWLTGNNQYNWNDNYNGYNQYNGRASFNGDNWNNGYNRSNGMFGYNNGPFDKGI